MTKKHRQENPEKEAVIDWILAIDLMKCERKTVFSV
jgi:hypothetical protein